MYFNGAVNLSGNGIGAVLVSQDGKHFPIAIKLRFDCTNNVAEYEACVMGLQATIDMKVRKLEVYGDSALIIYQVKGEWQTKDPKIKAKSKPAYYFMIEEEPNGKPWYHDILLYIRTREFPSGVSKNERRMIRRLALGYFPSGEILYKRSFNGELLRCVDAK
ncbi:hypothetical protein P3X46_018360 [Hevea brasiliensis]|uniref:RNase H type-1 domain-containing protein n=1 Tax=Hevea brasiliensis TaxID=3981 RepID=A0ABQ9LQI4_HEVBR|nr:hypothetical protein P3X46_018360 [Hevea brasiliensis]